jgi:hypothetical protein
MLDNFDFTSVDLTEPFAAVVVMTGIACWAIMVGSGLWFAVAGAIRFVIERIEARRAIRMLFPDVVPIADHDTIRSLFWDEPFDGFIIGDSNGSDAAIRIPRTPEPSR